MPRRYELNLTKKDFQQKVYQIFTKFYFSRKCQTTERQGAVPRNELVHSCVHLEEDLQDGDNESERENVEYCG